MDTIDRFLYKLFDIICIIMGISCAIIFIASVIVVVCFFWHACWPLGIIATAIVVMKIVAFIKDVISPITGTGENQNSRA
jgi:hypothetical protein